MRLLLNQQVAAFENLRCTHYGFHLLVVLRAGLMTPAVAPRPLLPAQTPSHHAFFLLAGGQAGMPLTRLLGPPLAALAALG